MVAAVFGASGQVGQALRAVASEFPGITLRFFTRDEADITSPERITSLLHQLKPEFCINLAAYTAVDKAEEDAKNAYIINTVGAANVARACRDAGVKLIMLSTDFVFDGTKSEPYSESDPTRPLSVYGKTKLQGEQEAGQITDELYIIRTSWIFSRFGRNFFNTMIRLAESGKKISVVDDQRGCPTFAPDLARGILRLIDRSRVVPFGLYHFCNGGETTWFEFAADIFDSRRLQVDLTPISTSDFGAAALRPRYSVLDTSKFQAAVGMSIRHWKHTLSE